MGLPSGLNKFRSLIRGGVGGGGVAGLDALAIPGREVMSWSEEVQEDEESGQGLGRLIGRLEEGKRKVGEELEWIQGQLDSESRECEGMRVSSTRFSS